MWYNGLGDPMATYLISSPTITQLNAAIKQIIGDVPYESIPNTTDLSEIIADLSYSSLFSSERNILIKNVDYFGTSKTSKENLALIEQYLDQENPDVNLIFTTPDKVDERKKITKTLKSRGCLIICPSLTIKDICKIIREELTQKGYQVTDEILYYIVNSCNNDYDIVNSEIAKIDLYYSKPCPLKLSDIKEIIAPSLETNNFKLIDAIMGHDLTTAFKIYQDLKVQKVEPFVIINLLAREYRLTYLVAMLSLKNTPEYEIAKKLNLQSWQVNKYLTLSYQYSTSELASNLLELANIDYQVKTGQINKYSALEVFILKSA